MDAQVDAPPVAVGKTFDTFEEVEKAFKLLERDYCHCLIHRPCVSITNEVRRLVVN